MKVAYCDCFSGISGDMFLAAMLDAGLSLEVLQNQLATLNLPDHWEMQTKKVMKGAIQATLLDVSIHEHEHTHHRHPADIIEIIEKSQISEKARKTSLAIFERLAQAEAKVHGTSVDHVHFHEVGAVDSILDIVGAAVGLDALGIERLYASALPLGSGEVNTQHGILPVPAPATLELMRVANAHVVASPARMEQVTPTGAAILATLATFEQPNMVLQATGSGAGQRDLPWPNILRFMIGESEDVLTLPHIIMETNIDDMSAEVFGHVMEKLFSAGALDVFFTSIQMKKNRPAVMLSVIAPRMHESALANLILKETSTFGVRVQAIARYEAGREMRTVKTEFGEIPVKIKILSGEKVQAAPEYAVCARLANEQSLPLLKVYQSALLAAERELFHKTEKES
jgi:pyridinium-3,5-bisthiocarboxylic acid mononucleotide nickel chelatase